MLEHFKSRVSFLDGCDAHGCRPIVYDEYIFAHHMTTGEVLGFYNMCNGSGYIADPSPIRDAK